MNEHILFVLLPMIGVPLIPFAAAWIKHFLTKFRVRMIVQHIEAISNDIKASMEMLRTRVKEVTELQKQIDAELPNLENRLHTIPGDPQTSEQAKATPEEKDRLVARALVIRKKLATLLKDFDSICVTLGNQADRLEALEGELHQYR
ncbi:hypothetical protein PITC_076560 [Penicillium italicum]|uniref:Uncharacterized protein n=1 Tax=Penicillium italicum TaxID=40296 RepID=A0A0A2KXF7_PENIT|nr:hypothetical protein PITC_076560 [Penicillium italicum]